MTRQSPDIGWTQHLDGARLWRGQLSGAAQAPVERTVEVAEAFRNALMRTARTLYGDHHLPPDLYPVGKVTAGAVEDHAHAFFLPEDLDGDGLIDHMAVASPARLGGLGFTRKGLALLNLCSGFWLKGVGDIAIDPFFLAPECPLGIDDEAYVWLSLTPFAPPLKRHSAEDQIIRSLARLSFPSPVAIERIARGFLRADREIPASTFVEEYIAPQRVKHVEGRDHRMAYWALTFSEPVSGPLMLGALSHFGLGRFAPVVDVRTWTEQTGEPQGVGTL